MAKATKGLGKGLGKGINALIPEEVEQNKENIVVKRSC